MQWKNIVWIIAGLFGPSIGRTLWDLLNLQPLGDSLSPTGYRAMRGIEASEIDVAAAANWLIWGVQLYALWWVIQHLVGDHWVASREFGKKMWDNVIVPWFVAPIAWTIIWCGLLPLIWWLLGEAVSYLPDLPRWIYRPGHYVYSSVMHIVGPAYDRFWEWLTPAFLRFLLKAVPWGQRFVERLGHYVILH